MRKIGGHVSASGGIDKAIERAAVIGGNCAQIFSGSPRVWQRGSLDAIDTVKIAAKQQELSVGPIFTHALYLLNLASDNPELVQKSIKAIAFDLAVDAKLNGGGVIVHVGSHQGRGWESARDQIAKEISQLLATAPRSAHFLIENAAGQNGKIGGDLEEIRWLLDVVGAEQLGWCLDTCHGFAGGYYLGEKAPAILAEEGWEARSMVAEIERLNLASTLRCVHVNDSRDAFGSGRDRHANLGEGNINQADLAYFLTHPLITDKPLILEVPGIEGEGPDAENIRRLKELVGEKR